MTTPTPTATTTERRPATRTEPTLPELAELIKTEHAAYLQASRDAVDRAMRAGFFLNQAKGKVGHGQWQSRLKDNCELSERTAQRYMQLAAGRPKLEEKMKSATVADLTLNQAVRLLGSEKEGPNDGPTSETPEKASDHVDKLIERLLKALEKLNEDNAKAAAAEIVHRLTTARYLERKKAA
jgi:hypothetical protein